jgi:hypothetical protein
LCTFKLPHDHLLLKPKHVAGNKTDVNVDVNDFLYFLSLRHAIGSAPRRC